MIKIKINELSKGFVVDYFDTIQDSDFDAEDIYCESWDAVVEFLQKKVATTIQHR